jgi:type II secretory pathway pseudopilin PulG
MLAAMQRRGTTLLELLVMILLLALLLGLGLPAIGGLRDRLAVDASVQAVTAALSRARLVAVAEQRIAILTLAQDSLVVRVVESPADTVLRWRGPGPGAGRVAATGVPRNLWFAPSGATIGVANGSYLFTRGAARRQVIISRYGRVRVV